jgi:hypothetical protein
MLKPKYFVLNFKNTNSIYGIHYAGSTKIIGFSTTQEAHKCKKALAYYKYKYGKWPLYVKNSIKSESIESKDSLMTIYNTIDINYAHTQSLIDFCTINNIGAVFCESFELVDSSFHLQGVKIEPPNNYDIYLSSLEKVYETS